MIVAPDPDRLIADAVSRVPVATRGQALEISTDASFAFGSLVKSTQSPLLSDLPTWRAKSSIPIAATRIFDASSAPVSKGCFQ